MIEWSFLLDGTVCVMVPTILDDSTVVYDVTDGVADTVGKGSYSEGNVRTATVGTVTYDDPLRHRTDTWLYTFITR